VGTTGAFDILSIDPDKKRIGVALVQAGAARGGGAGRVAQEVEDARDYTERQDVAPAESFGSLADKFRALKPRGK
jgi:hypothetical protein